MRWFSRSVKDETARETIEALRKELRELRNAYNAWFDLVAPELGFQAEKGIVAAGYGWEVGLYNPRQAASTTKPAETKVVRVEPIICAKKVGCETPGCINPSHAKKPRG